MNGVANQGTVGSPNPSFLVTDGVEFYNMKEGFGEPSVP